MFQAFRTRPCSKSGTLERYPIQLEWMTPLWQAHGADGGNIVAATHCVTPGK
jgi:hypothetical protein